MSWDATSYVKKLIFCPNGERITRSEKGLAMILADYHNTHYRVAWPKVPVLAEEALVKDRQCQHLLRSLESKRVICSKINKSGTHEGSEYRFCMLDCQHEWMSETGAVNCAPTGAGLRQERVQVSDKTHYKNKERTHEARAREKFVRDAEIEETTLYNHLAALLFDRRSKTARARLVERQIRILYATWATWSGNEWPVEHVAHFHTWWKTDWRSKVAGVLGKQPPTGEQVIALYYEAMAALNIKTDNDVAVEGAQLGEDEAARQARLLREQETGRWS